jgi:hypothetical protein
MKENIHRINDIIKQVPGLRYDSSVGNFECYRKDLYDFAVLIVRECAEVAADRDALDIYEEIREHFGVDTEIDTNKKIEESLHKADKDIREGLRKQYLEQLTRLNGDLS